ncbi:MAG: uncharacterized protein A8A55_1531 [Amphiamblys sp. WSBS2006]|nr:MAG: uncharacterized protein A8A55_1531 [Amphiamblys sp. WSBS2006]
MEAEKRNRRHPLKRFGAYVLLFHVFFLIFCFFFLKGLKGVLEENTKIRRVFIQSTKRGMFNVELSAETKSESIRNIDVSILSLRLNIGMEDEYKDIANVTEKDVSIGRTDDRLFFSLRTQVDVGKAVIGSMRGKKKKKLSCMFRVKVVLFRFIPFWVSSSVEKEFPGESGADLLKQILDCDVRLKENGILGTITKKTSKIDEYELEMGAFIFCVGKKTADGKVTALLRIYHEAETITNSIPDKNTFEIKYKMCELGDTPFPEGTEELLLYEETETILAGKTYLEINPPELIKKAFTGGRSKGGREVSLGVFLCIEKEFYAEVEMGFSFQSLGMSRNTESILFQIVCGETNTVIGKGELRKHRKKTMATVQISQSFLSIEECRSVVLSCVNPTTSIEKTQIKISDDGKVTLKNTFFSVPLNTPGDSEKAKTTIAVRFTKNRQGEHQSRVVLLDRNDEETFLSGLASRRAEKNSKAHGEIQVGFESNKSSIFVGIGGSVSVMKTPAQSPIRVSLSGEIDTYVYQADNADPIQVALKTDGMSLETHKEELFFQADRSEAWMILKKKIFEKENSKGLKEAIEKIIEKYTPEKNTEKETVKEIKLPIDVKVETQEKSVSAHIRIDSKEKLDDGIVVICENQKIQIKKNERGITLTAEIKRLVFQTEDTDKKPPVKLDTKITLHADNPRQVHSLQRIFDEDKIEISFNGGPDCTFFVPRLPTETAETAEKTPKEIDVFFTAINKGTKFEIPPLFQYHADSRDQDEQNNPLDEENILLKRGHTDLFSVSVSMDGLWGDIRKKAEGFLNSGGFVPLFGKRAVLDWKLSMPSFFFFVGYNGVNVVRVKLNKFDSEKSRAVECVLGVSRQLREIRRVTYPIQFHSVGAKSILSLQPRETVDSAHHMVLSVTADGGCKEEENIVGHLVANHIELFRGSFGELKDNLDIKNPSPELREVKDTGCVLVYNVFNVAGLWCTVRTNLDIRLELKCGSTIFGTTSIKNPVIGSGLSQEVKLNISTENTPNKEKFFEVISRVFFGHPVALSISGFVNGKGISTQANFKAGKYIPTFLDTDSDSLVQFALNWREKAWAFKDRSLPWRLNLKNNYKWEIRIKSVDVRVYVPGQFLLALTGKNPMKSTKEDLDREDLFWDFANDGESSLLELTENERTKQGEVAARLGSSESDGTKGPGNRGAIGLKLRMSPEGFWRAKRNTDIFRKAFSFGSGCSYPKYLAGVPYSGSEIQSTARFELLKQDKSGVCEKGRGFDVTLPVKLRRMPLPMKSLVGHDPTNEIAMCVPSSENIPKDGDIYTVVAGRSILVSVSGVTDGCEFVVGAMCFLYKGCEVFVNKKRTWKNTCKKAVSEVHLKLDFQSNVVYFTMKTTDNRFCYFNRELKPETGKTFAVGRENGCLIQSVGYVSVDLSQSLVLLTSPLAVFPAQEREFFIQFSDSCGEIIRETPSEFSVLTRPSLGSPFTADPIVCEPKGYDEKQRRWGFVFKAAYSGRYQIGLKWADTEGVFYQPNWSVYVSRPTAVK